jgi:dTDP-4-dehydrorhamnose reductase
MTSLDYCRSHPAESRAVNVEGTLALAARLSSPQTLCVFPSTNLVFDGSHPFQKADAPTCPRTEYGRQKAEAERRLRQLPGPVCVVRFTKVFGAGAPLLNKWAESLRRGETIQPFSDLAMAPVPLDFAIEVLRQIGMRRLEGVFQVSAADDVTYAEAAWRLARQIGAAEDLVQPTPVAAAGLSFEHLPAHTTLETSRLEAELGLAPPDPWKAIDLAVNL